MKIGVVSDTHGYFDPRLPQLLEGATEILHAGDVGSPQVLDQLRAVAPVQAVRGNIDALSLGLPPTLTRRYDGVEIICCTSCPGRSRCCVTGPRLCRSMGSRRSTATDFCGPSRNSVAS
ncbi:MAG: metallophosphatase family protein [Acidobacteriia bacterium]|nr:metallophosphatase family protein [Terriglobia bacterium]